MKILIVGASGMIGGEALNQCLAHSSIVKVVAFVRGDLPTRVADNPKLETVLVKDFAAWSDKTLEEHADAVGMIWAMGTNSGSLTADLEYPLAFMESMARILEARPRGSKFRYVHLSGKFVRQNPDEKLWLLERPRKIKGLLETKALQLAKDHAQVWQTFIVKPGGVVPRTLTEAGVLGVVTSMGAVLGENWSVRNDELGAFMAYLVMDGRGEASVIQNSHIVRRGRELLQAGRGASAS